MTCYLQRRGMTVFLQFSYERHNIEYLLSHKSYKKQITNNALFD